MPASHDAGRTPPAPGSDHAARPGAAGPPGRLPPDLAPERFRELGHLLVDRVADFLEELPRRPVTPGEPPGDVRAALGDPALPEHGAEAGALLDEAARLLFDHSLFNGHPRFWGYITSSAAPIGILSELLAAAVNPNVGAWILSPAATEIEARTVRWIAELIGFPASCGGLLVSGGNMANLVGFLAARRASATWDLRAEGAAARAARPMIVYASRETHTWIQKAADLAGLGTDAIRWIDVDGRQRMDPDALRAAVRRDAAAGRLPFLAVATAGTVGTGAVDPIPAIRDICRDHGLWLHVDGAYGAFAAALPDAPEELAAMRDADSVAVDPHKWLYAPLEAGCALVRDPAVLRDAFAYHPAYYRFGSGEEEPPLNYFEYGPQNSRGFRALKVWLALRHAGREGYRQAIARDVRLAQLLHRLAADHPELEAVSHGLSITTFRYVPRDLRDGGEDAARHLDRLNAALLDRLQRGGEAFISNAVVDGRFVLRACIVNFRTTEADVRALPGIVARLGREVDQELRGGERSPPPPG